MARWQVKSTSAFTLIEAMLAMMILSIALGACILSFSLAMRTVNTASNQMTALHVARDRLETLRTNSFTAGDLNAGTYSFTNGTYTGQYVISSVNTSTKDITVNVLYTNRLRHNFSTNTLNTTITSTLHP